MHRKNRNRFDWYKPRFNRSKPKILKGKAAEKAISAYKHGSIGVDHCTHWKSPISLETFEELVERGLLSPKQIEQYHKRQEEEHKKNPKLKTAKVKKHKSFALIAEIAKYDLTTIEGLEAFKKIIERSPEALNLVSEAQKLRAANE